MTLFSLKQFFVRLRRGFAERPSSKKVSALKKAQKETKEDRPVVEIELPPIGQPLTNIKISPSPSTDPILLSDSEYPEWIWSARGPCRAALRSTDIEDPAAANYDNDDGNVAKLKKYLRLENRKSIRKKNSLLKGSSQ